jgi:hypothetical protein
VVLQVNLPSLTASSQMTQREPQNPSGAVKMKPKIEVVSSVAAEPGAEEEQGQGPTAEGGTHSASRAG